MGQYLPEYLRMKVHPQIHNNHWSHIVVKGEHQRDPSVVCISSIEKKDRPFNWQRLTASLGNSERLPQQAPRTMLIVAVLQEGYDNIRVQSLPTRAPEVWRGLGCWHSSDVWSLGVTVSPLPTSGISAD